MTEPVKDSASLLMFLRQILLDMGDLCSTSTTLDFKRIERRFEHEGLSFLTITLPSFGREFERALDQGFVAPGQFASFSRKGCLPRFLGGFMELVFDRNDGLLLEVTSTDAIYAIRQITLLFGKIKIACSDARVKATVNSYLECEKEIHASISSFEDFCVESFKRISALLWDEPLQKIALAIDFGDVVPRHGTGATADRLTGNRKWRQRTWTSRLETTFPCSDWLIPGYRFVQNLADVEILEPGAEIPVKVICVPKTPKGPRIIAEEPAHMMYVQLGLLDEFMKAIDADDIASALISWRSSRPNQRLARLGSRNGSLATLDLSEASDRVSVPHVEALLARHPSVLEAVMACRSSKAEVPGHGIVTLAKFASMGSGLTFPLESMVFATTVFVAIESTLNRRLTRKDVYFLLGRVRIYGDDIVVPVEYVQSTRRTLEQTGFKVNSDKSFWTGKFRESCGKEYYGGSDVTIVRVRREFPTCRRDAQEIESVVALRNHAYRYGLWRTARFLDGFVRGLIPFPNVSDTSPVLGRYSFLGYETHRLDDDLQSPLVKGCVVSKRPPRNGLDDVPALLKYLVTSGELPNPDTKHLERSGRARSSSIKTGWYSPF